MSEIVSNTHGASTFFEIPVYRLTQSAYHEQREAHVNRLFNKLVYTGNPIIDESARKFYDENPSSEYRLKQRIRGNYGGEWRFNEVIGYIRLRFIGHRIRAEYWTVSAKRITRTRKKVFNANGRSIIEDVLVPIESDDNKIFDIILNVIQQHATLLKNRFVNTEEFINIGRHVRWRSLIDSNV